MWARTRFDIRPADLVYGLRSALRPPDRETTAREVEALWSPGGDALSCYSVRSAFDLALRALELPAASEVLFSALNIKGMPRIARRLGLVPVPVDLELDTMGPSLASLERAVGPRSRALVVAPLFGTRFDLAPLVEFARRHRLLLIEDCAQAFCGRSFTGHEEADLSLFSFGQLKFATALGGALARVRDPALLERMRALQARDPVQTDADYLGRLVKFCGLSLITLPAVLGTVAGVSAALGKDYEDAVADPVRRVAKLGSARSIRKRPPGAMLALLRRRLLDFDDAHLAPRREKGRRLLALLDGAVSCPGTANKVHNFWAFPVLSQRPVALMAALRREGFDAATLRRSAAVAAPEDRPELDPRVAREALARLLVLPCYPALPDAELERMAAVVRRTVSASNSSA